MRDTDLGVGDISVDDVVCLAVGGENVLESSEGKGYALDARGRAAVKVASDQDDIGLVEGNPVADVPER